MTFAELQEAMEIMKRALRMPYEQPMWVLSYNDWQALQKLGVEMPDAVKLEDEELPIR